MDFVLEPSSDKFSLISLFLLWIRKLAVIKIYHIVIKTWGYAVHKKLNTELQDLLIRSINEEVNVLGCCCWLAYSKAKMSQMGNKRCILRGWGPQFEGDWLGLSWWLTMSSLFSIENPATAEWWWKLINHDEMATKCVTFETGASVYKSVVYHEKSTLSTYFVSISMIYGRYVNLFTPM